MKGETFSIGTIVDSRKKLEINLPVLLRSRLLIQANAGGGKSYLLRKILEETNGKVQQIVLDAEGEFSSLREKFDYLLVGKDGDIPTDVRSAELLAKNLLSLKVSAIVDLYELKHYERIAFVKKFLHALVNAPKTLWHPVLIVLDEGHMFAPEKGKAESLDSVIEEASRGRKRGQCLIVATQRIAKLHKDVAAECANNMLIGRTGLDIDIKRASEMLGFYSKEQQRSLRHLKAGEFFAFGNAISQEILKVKIDKVKTTHPEAGRGLVAVTAPATSKIKKALAKLTDLPKKAEEELREVEDYQKKIRELKHDLKKSPVQVDKRELERVRLIEANRVRKEFEKVLFSKDKENRLLAGRIEKIRQLAAKPAKTSLLVIPLVAPKVQPIIKKPAEKQEQTHERDSSEIVLKRCEKMIFSLLANNPSKHFSINNVACLAGYSNKSGGFKNSLSKLNSFGLISKDGKDVSITSEGQDLARSLLGKEYTLFETFTLKNWSSHLKACERAIFNLFLEDPALELSREEIAEATDYKISGGFKNALSRLNSLGLLKRKGDLIKINEELLEEM